ncbi:hypothetical protein [uncultured Roseobacter sp.]|uniref:hypothetical protein n=1 Tax=uncultured Roseobacter sp. TaxID=114847 RepID=UPI0026217346|nr:hypothetical protein [uncultured Roseobacter sp.]
MNSIVHPAVVCRGSDIRSESERPRWRISKPVGLRTLLINVALPFNLLLPVFLKNLPKKRGLMNRPSQSYAYLLPVTTGGQIIPAKVPATSAFRGSWVSGAENAAANTPYINPSVSDCQIKGRAA